MNWCSVLKEEKCQNNGGRSSGKLGETHAFYLPHTRPYWLYAHTNGSTTAVAMASTNLCESSLVSMDETDLSKCTGSSSMVVASVGERWTFSSINSRRRHLSGTYPTDLFDNSARDKHEMDAEPECDVESRSSVLTRKHAMIVEVSESSRKEEMVRGKAETLATISWLPSLTSHLVFSFLLPHSPFLHLSHQKQRIATSTTTMQSSSQVLQVRSGLVLLNDGGVCHPSAA